MGKITSFLQGTVSHTMKFIGLSSLTNLIFTNPMEESKITSLLKCCIETRNFCDCVAIVFILQEVIEKTFLIFKFPTNNFLHSLSFF